MQRRICITSNKFSHFRFITAKCLFWFSCGASGGDSDRENSSGDDDGDGGKW